MTLTIGSLFSGIGAMDLGLERAGCKVIWQCEIDDYCRRVLEKHWPGVPKYGDIRDLNAADLVPVDVLAGGFPCQDISPAGYGAGITGERSGLWSEFARIIRELRPRYVLVENVSALLGRGLDVVLGDLAALGFDAEWNCIPASAVGAPHRRDRIWIVAYPNDRGAGRLALCQSPEVGWRGFDDGGATREVADTTLLRVEGDRSNRFVIPPAPIGTQLLRRYRAGPGAAQWQIEPNVDRMVDGTPITVDRHKCIGNAVVPQVVEFIGRCIVEDAA